MIVADSDVLIDFLAGSGEGADAVARELRQGDLHTTAVTCFDLLSGARSTRQMPAVAKLLAALPAVPVDEAAACAAGEVRRTLEASGTAPPGSRPGNINTLVLDTLRALDVPDGMSTHARGHASSSDPVDYRA